jgi:hypothetical protein
LIYLVEVGGGVGGELEVVALVEGGDGVLNLGFEVVGSRRRLIGSRFWWG